MAQRRPRTTPTPSLVVEAGQPLIGVILEESGREVTRAFSSGEEADAAGAWADLDWDEILGRIRHESPPSPPIEV